MQAERDAFEVHSLGDIDREEVQEELEAFEIEIAVLREQQTRDGKRNRHASMKKIENGLKAATQIKELLRTIVNSG